MSLHDEVEVERLVPEALSGAEALAARACLTPEEQERGAGFAREADRRRFWVVRAALRRRAAEALGGAPVTLRVGPWGKPEVDGVHVNASHAPGLALVAITRAGPVGVDVERLDREPRADELDLARRFFTAAEADALAAVAPRERPRAFLRLWTRKEAALKAWGRGVSGGLDVVDARAVGATWTRLSIDGFGPVWVTDLDVGPGHLAALAVIGDPPSRVRVR